ncbi:hypothetical protein WKI65_44070 [Streptomyces sp. MS1.AVA.3]|uniref:hypothetical protein n=1 Tax=Streptomyces decoyicus TaxID=249567 RepID=UPI0030BDDD58
METITTEQLCTSTYTREWENDAITYTCSRPHGHPGVHRSDITETLTHYRNGEPREIEDHIEWTHWEEFLAAQRTSSDEHILALGAALTATFDWYEDMLSGQPRYAALTTK